MQATPADAGAEDAAEDASADDAADGAHQSPDSGSASQDAAPIDVPCDVNPPTSCPEPPVRYGDIEPILKERCLSCHDGLGEQWPLTTYSHVAGWSNEIRSAMTTCAMPPADAGIDMPTSEREQILAWLVCGMPR